MKLLSLFILLTLVTSNALAGDLTCKGGLIFKGTKTLSTLEGGEFEPDLLYGDADNEAVGRYAFLVKKIGTSLDLVITSEDSGLIARTITESTKTILLANLGKGYSASIECSEEEKK